MKKVSNIVYVNTVDKIGGAAGIAYALMKKIQNKKIRTSMFVAHKYSHDRDVHLIKGNSPFDKFTVILTDFICQYSANDISIPGIDRLLKSEEFKSADIVHLHNLHGNYFNLSCLPFISKVKPVIWTFHDEWAIMPHGVHPPLQDDRFREGFLKSSSPNEYPVMAFNNSRYLRDKKKEFYQRSKFTIVVPCKWLKERVEKSILRDHPVKLIYNGIDTGIFRKTSQESARKELGLPSRKKIVLFVASGGAANPQKGWKYIPPIRDYIKNHQEIMLVNIGGKGKTSHRKGNLLFVDYIENKKMLVSYYCASDLLVFSSLAETFPVVVLEAMACGIPIVSFDVGGVSEAVIHKKNGYIAQYNSPQDLLEGVKFILSLDKNETGRMASDSINRIKKNFSLAKMTDEYLKLYESAAVH